MNIKVTSILIMLYSLAACAFFEQPLDEFGSATLPVPDNNASATLPAPLPVNTPTDSSTPAPAVNSNDIYFTVVTLFEIPEDAANISFVHFTKRNTDRELAMCQTLLNNFAVTKAADVPANAENLIVWPVRNEATGATCIEMLSDYENIDISNQTAEKVNDQSDGPYLLTRNTPADRRLIYDLSYVKPRAIPTALTQWQSLIDSEVASWPPYQSAR